MHKLPLLLLFTLLFGCAQMNLKQQHSLETSSSSIKNEHTSERPPQQERAEANTEKHTQALNEPSDLDYIHRPSPWFNEPDLKQPASVDSATSAPKNSSQSRKPQAQPSELASFVGQYWPLPTKSAKPTEDFSAYGFVTPTGSLETLVNDELASLRPHEVVPDKDLWDRIRKGFQLDLALDNPRIRAQLNWYAKNPDYLNRTFSRASYYLHHIVNEIEKRQLPMELALLPLVESAFDPFAYSHGRASGLWQFIPGTGKIYGLHQNWWYDGRRDVLASTKAALDYMEYLSKRFDGDWLHALASYNSGSGRVSSAIRRNKKKGRNTDFWSLKLPRETKAYVPKLLAIAKLAAEPAKYNIKLKAIPDIPYFKVVKLDSQIDLAQAATMAKIDITELYKLNPGFNQWATDPLGPHRLLLPVNSVEHFEQALAELPANQRVTWNRYSVKSGDSLIKIAKKFHTTPALIKQVNHLRSNTIRVKQKLLIPVASKGKQYYGLSAQNRLSTKQSKVKAPPGSQKIVHKVVAGDTLWELSLAHKVSMRKLAKWNGMAPTDVLKPGKELLIWSRANVQQQINTAKEQFPNINPQRQMIKRIGYRVRRGDSLARIASKFNVRVSDLVSWNKLNKKHYLQPGQKLTIYVDITNS